MGRPIEYVRSSWFLGVQSLLLQHYQTEQKAPHEFQTFAPRCPFFGTGYYNHPVEQVGVYPHWQEGAQILSHPARLTQYQKQITLSPLVKVY